MSFSTKIPKESFDDFNFSNSPRKTSAKTLFNYFGYSIHERVCKAPSGFASVIFRRYGQINWWNFFHYYVLKCKRKIVFRLIQPSETIS